MVLLKELVSGLQDMLEGGRLKESDIPDDYQWLTRQIERMKGKKTPDDSVYINLAKQQYCNDDVEIDDECVLSHADQGAWVSAWVWVYDAEVAETNEAQSA